MLDKLKVFTGRAHPQLANDICKELSIPLGKSEIMKCTNDDSFVPDS